jgi:hypothetical protein
VRETLDVWPALPLLISGSWDEDSRELGSENVIPILELSDRVCQIHLNYIRASEWEKISAAMQVSFPKLTVLALTSYEKMTIVPDSFLGGSAPRLRWLVLEGIPFPGLSKLLLSATHLVTLYLGNIPHSGYISPEEMVTALSTLTSLGSLSLHFTSPRSCPDQASRHLPQLTRTVLPFLSMLTFNGASEYLEDFVARIDAPRLLRLRMTFFNDLVFDIPQSVQFIRRTPSFETLKKACVFFESAAARVILTSVTSPTSVYENLEVGILCKESDWQVSSLEQVFTSSLLPLPTLEDLYIHEHPHSHPHWQDNIENTLWLELLQPFTTVKNLYLSKEFAPRVLPVLQELVGERTTKVLPTLQNILLEELEPSGPIQKAIEQFVAARQVTGHPIAVSRWDNSEQDKEWIPPPLFSLY